MRRFGMLYCVLAALVMAALETELPADWGGKAGKGAPTGVKITDATDKQIVQRFLEHVDRLAGRITREYCRKMAADEPEGYTWKVLPDPANRKLLQSLSFDVTGKGYKAPPRP